MRVEVVPDPADTGRLAQADLIERFQDRIEELGAAIGGVADRLPDALAYRYAVAQLGGPAELLRLRDRLLEGH